MLSESDAAAPLMYNIELFQLRVESVEWHRGREDLRAIDSIQMTVLETLGTI